MSERWIVIPNWDRFQHYKDRDLKWVKMWVRLLHEDEYIGLSFHLRGVLHGLWMAYATSNGQLRDTTSTLHRHLGHRVLTRDLVSLNDAGFIGFSDTKPAPIRTLRLRDRERDLTKPLTARTKPTISGSMVALRTLIANGVIRDEIDLEAELRSGDHRLNDLERQELVSELKKRREAA